MTDDLRQLLAEAMAAKAGSQAFKIPHHAWDGFRNLWLGYADAALTVRDDEMERLRAEHETQADSIRSYQADIREAEAAVTRVRRLCELTIAASCRVQAIEQARDTLAALDDAERRDGRS